MSYESWPATCLMESANDQIKVKLGTSEEILPGSSIFNCGNAADAIDAEPNANIDNLDAHDEDVTPPLDLERNPMMCVAEWPKVVRLLSPPPTRQLRYRKTGDAVYR